MEQSVGEASINSVLSRVLDGDLECCDDLQFSQSSAARMLYAFVKKYRDNLLDSGGYFRAESHKIKLLSLTNEERIDSGSNIAKANEYVAAASQKQALLSKECADMAGVFRERFGNMLGVSKEHSSECEKAKTISREGRSYIMQYLDESKKTQDLLVNIADKTSNLLDNVGKIKKILSLINEIYDQTNILAINAHIESVHAGSAGTGFAVIAREIKSLATKSKQASDDIYDTVEGIIGETSEISRTVQAGKSLAESQSESIASVGSTMDNIDHAIDRLMRHQAKSFELIQELDSSNNRMIAEISNIASESQKSAATCQVVSDMSSNQSKQDQEFQDMLHAFLTFHEEHAEILFGANGPGGAGGEKKIGIICLEQDEFYREVERAAFLTGEQRNVQVISKTPAHFSIEDQLKGFDELMKQKVDGIILVPGDAGAFKGRLDEARSRGIKVVCVDADVADGAKDAYVTSDNFEGGRLSGKAAAKALDGKGRIYVLLCASEIFTVQQRLKGFEEEIRKFDGLRILKIIEQKDTSRDVTEKLLETVVSESSQFDLLYLVTAESGEIAVDLWDKNQLSNKLVVLSKSNKITTGVAQEIVSAQIVQNNKAWGESAVQKLADLFEGKTVAEYEDTGMRELNRKNFVVAGG